MEYEQSLDGRQIIDTPNPDSTQIVNSYLLDGKKTQYICVVVSCSDLLKVLDVIQTAIRLRPIYIVSNTYLRVI